LAFAVCSYREVANVNVHAGVLVELPLRAQQGEPGSDGAVRSGANKPSRICEHAGEIM